MVRVPMIVLQEERRQQLEEWQFFKRTAQADRTREDNSLVVHAPTSQLFGNSLRWCIHQHGSKTLRVNAGHLDLFHDFLALVDPSTNVFT